MSSDRDLDAPAPDQDDLDRATAWDRRASFETVSRQEWEAAASVALRGKPLTSLDSVTLDGVTRSPLYTHERHSTDADQAGLPGAAPFTRGASAAGSVLGWEIRQTHDAAAPGANAAVLRDLERGVTAISLANAPSDVDALDAVLDGVYLDLAPIHLAPRSTPGQRAALMGLAQRRGVPGSNLTGMLGADPIGQLATSGVLASSLADAVAAAADEATRRRVAFPNVRSIAVDLSLYADAGASDAQELGAGLAAGVAWLRALTDAGLEINEAAAQLEFTVSVGPDQFLSITKLRALRTTWSRIVQVSGAGPATAPITIHALTSAAMMSQRDPWVNMLRTTTACFAAAVGGAAAITVQPFDSALGASDELGLRIARNTQLILQDETHAAAVIDPAGGSWYVEDLTSQLALSAWNEFQAIERAGGIGDALSTGSLQRSIAATRSTRLSDIAMRRTPIIGVSEFPDIHETAVRRTPPQDVDPAQADADTAAALCEPLPIFRWAAPFEELRDAADQARSSGPLTIFLASLGPIATHAARTTFAKNLFEVGGIEAVDGGADSEDTTLLAASFSATGSALACICSSDAVYAERAADVATALKAAGAKRVYLAGAPGDHETELRGAGVDEFIHLGCDVLAALRSAHAAIYEAAG